MIRLFKGISNPKDIYKLSLASWRLMDGRVDKAIPLFEHLTKKYPNNGPVLAMMGMALVKQGEVTKGVDTLKESLQWIQKDDKHLSEIYAYIGYGSLLKNNYDDALKFNSLAAEHWNESNIEFPRERVYANLGLSYEKKNYLNDAIESYHNGLNFNQKDTSLYKRLIKAYCLSGKYHKAHQKLKELLSIDPALRNDDTVRHFKAMIEKEMQTIPEGGGQ